MVVRRLEQLPDSAIPFLSRSTIVVQSLWSRCISKFRQHTTVWSCTVARLKSYIAMKRVYNGKVLIWGNANFVTSNWRGDTIQWCGEGNVVITQTINCIVAERNDNVESNVKVRTSAMQKYVAFTYPFMLSSCSGKCKVVSTWDRPYKIALPQRYLLSPRPAQSWCFSFVNVYVGTHKLALSRSRCLNV